MRKTILDACCGGKMFYFDKHDERVLFQDIRKVSTGKRSNTHWICFMKDFIKEE